MHDNPVDVASKVIQLFQVIMHSVQTYLKNVEMFIYNKYPDKLNILINFIINAVTICQKRLIFDKRDKAIQQLLQKCSDMKRYLEMNQQSLAKFVSIQQNRKMSLHSRGSFAYENNYGSKLSMYDMTSKTSKTRKPILPSKSPYDALIPRNLKSSHSTVTSKQKLPLSRVQSRTLQRVKSPMLKKSSSNISTAMQRLKDSESNEIVKTLSEKAYEENESAAPSRKGNEIMEMMNNIAKEKIQEMLTPFLNELKKRLPCDKFSNEESTIPTSPSLRVTSEVKESQVTSECEKPQKGNVLTPERPKNIEKIQNVSKNVQYIYVKSNEEKKKSKNDSQTNSAQSKLRPSPSKAQLTPSKTTIESTGSQHKSPEMNIVSSKAKPPIAADKKISENVMKELKEQALKERLEYVEQMMENPLYVNKAYNEPWKIFAG